MLGSTNNKENESDGFDFDKVKNKVEDGSLNEVQKHYHNNS